VRGFLCLLIVRPGRNLLLAIMLWVSLVGTSESFMQHPANDRSWPKALVRVIHMNDRSVPNVANNCSAINVYMVR
jgi:hypothetical protein